MFVHVVLTEDLREDWTCPTEPPHKIKSSLLLLLLLLLLLFELQDRPSTASIGEENAFDLTAAHYTSLSNVLNIITRM